MVQHVCHNGKCIQGRGPFNAQKPISWHRRDVMTSEQQKQIVRLQQLLAQALSDDDSSWGELQANILDMCGGAGLYWPGKFQSIAERPRVEETPCFVMPHENLFIEGDNLRGLQMITADFQNAVKMIYIDPPYNTGQPLTFSDKFRSPTRSRRRGEGDSHSAWLDMMYPRLRLARPLLREDGAIFISIGDTELAHLILLADEVFGEANRVAILTRVAKLTSNKGRHFSPTADYILCYAKNIAHLPEFTDPMAQDRPSYRNLFRHRDERGAYNEVSLYMPSLDFRPHQHYAIQCPDHTWVIPPTGKVFRWTEETYRRNLAEGRVVFKQTSTSPLRDRDGNRASWNIYTKIYLSERLIKGLRPNTVLHHKTFTNARGSKQLLKWGIRFSFAKPVELVKFLMDLDDDPTGIYLDFFAGTGPLAEAVMRKNYADGGQRRFILMQWPEAIRGQPDTTVSDITRMRLDKVVDELARTPGPSRWIAPAIRIVTLHSDLPR